MNYEYMQILVPQLVEQYGDEIGRQLETVVCSKLQQKGITPTPDEKQRMQQQLKQTLSRGIIMELPQEHHDSFYHIMDMDPQQSHAPSRQRVNFGPSVSPPDAIKMKVFDYKQNPDEVIQMCAMQLSAACEYYKKHHQFADETDEKR